MKLRRTLVPGVCMAVLTSVVVACGGTSGSDLFTKSDPTLGSGRGEGSSTSTATGEPGGSPDASVATPDASTETTPDAGTETKDSGAVDPPAPLGKIRCGDDQCEAGSEVCCIAYGGPGKASVQCRKAATGCGFALKIACDDQSDCATGQVCCGARENATFLSVSCRATCEGTEKEPAARFCDAKAEPDECAAINAECKSGDLGYGICRN